MKKHDNIDFNTMSEQATRKKLLIDAKRRFGPEGARQLQMMFDKYDTLLKKCTNITERKHIQKIAAADVYKVMGYRGGLTVDHEMVIPDDSEINA